MEDKKQDLPANRRRSAQTSGFGNQSSTVGGLSIGRRDPHQCADLPNSAKSYDNVYDPRNHRRSSSFRRAIPEDSADEIKVE
jgi:hypothetical protein